MYQKDYDFLGFIIKKEATNLSVFNEAGSRIVGGNVGDAVVRLNGGDAFIIPAHEWLAMPKDEKAAAKKEIKESPALTQIQSELDGLKK